MILFSEPAIYGTLIRRYQRFFMDVRLDCGETVVAHTPNTGSMLGLLAFGNLVLLTKSNDKSRGTAYTAQAIRQDGVWVGINTHLPNKLVAKNQNHPLLSYLSPYESIRREVPYGRDLRSRADFLFSDSKIDGISPLYLEVKSVSLALAEMALFPDTVSLRAQKHVHDLLFVMNQGFRACLLFIVQRIDCLTLSPADHIDKTYSELLIHAKKQGLMVKAVSALINSQGLRLYKELECLLH